MTSPVINVNPLVALLVELVPHRPAPTVTRGTWTQEERDAHWAALCEAVGTPGAARPEPHPGH